MILYKENDFINYIKTEVKYPHRKPFLFLKEKEEDSIYKYMVRDEKGKYFIQLWNDKLPNKDEIKKYLNEHKPLTEKQIEEKKLEKLKEQEEKLSFKNLYYKNRKKYLTAYDRNQNFKEKFEERVPLNSVKYCLYKAFKYPHYFHFSNLPHIEKEIFKIIYQKYPNIPFKQIPKEEYDICKINFLNQKKEEYFHTGDLFNSDIVENYFTKYDKVINEFGNINNIFLNLYNENVKYWKNTRNLINENGKLWNIHHIRPRSMFGCNDEINLVKVTLEEHRVLHSILTLIYPYSTYMKKAFSYMLFGDDPDITGYFLRADNARILMANFFIYKSIENNIIKFDEKILNEIKLYLCKHLTLFQTVIILLYTILKEKNIERFVNVDIHELEETYDSLEKISKSVLKKGYNSIMKRNSDKMCESCIEWSKQNNNSMIEKFIYIQNFL